MKRRRTVVAAVAVIGAAALLAGCEEDEQGRVLWFEPGVYKGSEPQAIDDAARQSLRDRISYQNY